MSNYRIHCSHNTTYEISTQSGIVVTASRPLDWAVGLDFPHVRSWCEGHGFIVEPVPEPRERNIFSFGGSLYEVLFINGRRRIFQDGEEVGQEDLPQALKGIL